MKNITTRQHYTNEHYMDPDELMAREARRERLRTLEKQPGMFSRIITVMHNKSVGEVSLNMGKNFESTRDAARAAAHEIKVTPAAQLAADRVMGIGDFAPLREAPKAQDNYTRALNEIAQKVATQPLNAPLDAEAIRKQVADVHSTSPQAELELPIQNSPAAVVNEAFAEVSDDLDTAWIDELSQQAADMRAEDGSVRENV